MNDNLSHAIYVLLGGLIFLFFAMCTHQRVSTKKNIKKNSERIDGS